ncbi:MULTISPECIES: GNAT family N-acetyltransferase [unclassified Streptomyces]|uniref:GNAT family N-acetyltransferase n=1 Tax=unclassified Streptomyces TaxID=2593676 RepID=UPI002E14FD51|nr:MULTISPECIES: GNAT family N-acetyltransferase [unclassified Streptomyces]WSR26139.1 GNAT family N-acetyltransferase [Streptomyces sp. NBC_01205]
MPQQGIIAIERMDGAAAVRAGEAFRLIYAEAFAEPPYGETEEDVAAAFRRFPVQARKHGFRAVLARAEGDGEPIGMAYGFPLGPDTVWWDELTEPVPEAMRREDGRRTFGLMELAVRGPWRGQGVARRLHTALLLDAVGAERVMLNVNQASGEASAAYRAWGYRKIGEARPLVDGAELRDVMLLDLR